MSSDLQFDQAEFSEASSVICSSCQIPVMGDYYALNQQLLCGNCTQQVREVIDGKGSSAGRFLQAILLGSGAVLVGTAVYAAVMIFTQSEWGIISIAIGWFIGSAVRRGSKGRGGWRYQLLAAFFTYTSICAAYGVVIWSEAGVKQSLELALGIILSAYGLPFMQGAGNILGLFIIGFGVWRAWRMNQAIQLEITGPHRIAPLPPSSPPPLPNAEL
jgi:hypothetical protein